MVHVRFNGRSLNIHEKELGIGSFDSDRQIKDEIARHLRVNKSQFAGYVVDRTKTGNLIVRPEAVYG
jgi:hypothetical protein